MEGAALFWLLLPVAAASGYWFAWRTRTGATRRGVDGDYVEGINHLLNEQPDRAVDSFIHLLEAHPDTAGHLALGNLYRRRGEVDNAIRIHQSLASRRELSAESQRDALLELAQDFMSAGLLDRAEELYLRLAEHGDCQVQALRQLIDIYEREKDWSKAIDTAAALERATGNRLGHVIAQYHCELARQHERRGDGDAALDAARRALEVHADCVRASLLEGDLLFARGEHARALLAFQRVERQGPEYLSESVPRVAACFRALERPEEMQAWLEELVTRRGAVSAQLELADLLSEREGVAAAADRLCAQLGERPALRALEKLLELESQRNDRAPAPQLAALKRLTTELARRGHKFRCAQCGFEARALHWQCPGCKGWSTVRPLQGAEAP